MPEQDNDRLERFFQKAAHQPEIPFNELDWKKLEARLDAAGYRAALYQKQSLRIAGAAALLVALMWTTLYLDADRPGVASAAKPPIDTEDAAIIDDGAAAVEPVPSTRKVFPEPRTEKNNLNQRGEPEHSVSPTDQPRALENAGTDRRQDGGRETAFSTRSPDNAEPTVPMKSATVLTERVLAETVTPQPREKLYRDLILTTPASADKIQQRASSSLPGAEEVIGRNGASIEEEQESDRKKYEDSQRLSLLLSFAPDFSGTTMHRYSAPGKSFGAMIHYHVGNKWRFSTGVVKSNKKYVGEGEDYKPPKNYWTYYTNGVVPASIDGSCNIVEIPIMVQYNVKAWGRNRLLAGAGMSNYIMLNESYRYYFEQPNPGAKEGWASRESSRFLWNMVNFTVAYEREVLHGLHLGVEPYVKVPVEEIGWTNLKLFSSGISLTARYRLLKKRPSVSARSRGPD